MTIATFSAALGVSNSLGNDCASLQQQQCIPQPSLAINGSNTKPADRSFLLRNRGGEIMAILPACPFQTTLPVPRASSAFGPHCRQPYFYPILSF